MFQLHFMIEKWTPNFLTLSTTFYDVSVSCNRFPKTEIGQFGASGTDRLNNSQPIVISDKDHKETAEKMETMDRLVGLDLAVPPAVPVMTDNRESPDAPDTAAPVDRATTDPTGTQVRDSFGNSKKKNLILRFCKFFIVRKVAFFGLSYPKKKSQSRGEIFQTKKNPKAEIIEKCSGSQRSGKSRERYN